MCQQSGKGATGNENYSATCDGDCSSLILAASAIAQTAATADLHGTVKDPNGAVIQNATITVRDEARNFERSAQSERKRILYPALTAARHITHSR